LALLLMLAAFALAAAGLLMGARPADVAVVLGNTVQADGRPSPRLAARLDRAYECYAASQCRILFVSGGVDPAARTKPQSCATTCWRVACPPTAS
jgi:hypothetical protein